MLNLLTSSQTRSADAFTIVNKPVASIDLMENASLAFSRCFMQHFPKKEITVSVYCGTGNNGGDGLAIARLLMLEGYSVSVKIADFGNRATAGFEINVKRLKESGVPFTTLDPLAFPPEEADVLIDALLGSGLNKPMQGNWALLAKHLNQLSKPVIAVDIPTGMLAEGVFEPGCVAVKASLTITFQRPKINFFFPESARFQDGFESVGIGLDEGFMQLQNNDFKLLEDGDIRQRLKLRKPFSHKGSYGHALIIAGAHQTMGAALLCAEASVYSGSGLTTACIPSSGLTALNTRLPEAIALLRDTDFVLHETNQYTAIAGAWPWERRRGNSVNQIAAFNG